MGAGKGHREESTGLWFHSLVQLSLVESCLCPDGGLNPQPWRVGTVLQPTEVPSPGKTTRNLSSSTPTS